MLYTFIHIIYACISNSELNFVIYMKLVQSMGSPQIRHSSNTSPLPTLLYKGGIDFL